MSPSVELGSDGHSQVQPGQERKGLTNPRATDEGKLAQGTDPGRSEARFESVIIRHHGLPSGLQLFKNGKAAEGNSAVASPLAGA